MRRSFVLVPFVFSLACETEFEEDYDGVCELSSDSLLPIEALIVAHRDSHGSKPDAKALAADVRMSADELSEEHVGLLELDLYDRDQAFVRVMKTGHGSEGVNWWTPVNGAVSLDAMTSYGGGFGEGQSFRLVIKGTRKDGTLDGTCTLVDGRNSQEFRGDLSLELVD